MESNKSFIKSILIIKYHNVAHGVWESNHTGSSNRDLIYFLVMVTSNIVYVVLVAFKTEKKYYLRNRGEYAQ